MSRLLGVGRRLGRAAGWLLHPWFRARARRVARGLTGSGGVLVLCHGNICRSPMAEHLLRRELARAGLEDIGAASAGFIKPGRPSPPPAVAVAARFGIDLGDHRSRLVTPALARGAAVVVVMEPQQARALRAMYPDFAGPLVVLGDLDARFFAFRAIGDPIDQPEPVFEQCYQRLARCSVELVALVASARRRSRFPYDAA